MTNMWYFNQTIIKIKKLSNLPSHLSKALAETVLIKLAMAVAHITVQGLSVIKEHTFLTRNHVGLEILSRSNSSVYFDTLIKVYNSIKTV